MTHQDNAELCCACMKRLPERLALRGLRGWLAGYESGDIRCWETVWNEHATALGVHRAKQVVMELSRRVHVLRSAPPHPARFRPPSCHTLCTDERLALALVPACQAEARAATEAAARELAGPKRAKTLIHKGRGYAAVLTAHDLRLTAFNTLMRDLASGEAHRLN